MARLTLSIGLMCSQLASERAKMSRNDANTLEPQPE